MDRQPYESDLRDIEWEAIKEFVPQAKDGGRPAYYERREIVNAILYVLENGIKWRAMPHDLPCWKTVFNYFSAWRKQGVWARIRQELVARERRRLGREPSPSVALIDSQSVKTAGPGAERGYDGNKKTKGRKRHAITDVNSLLLAVLITAANVHDATAAARMIEQAGLKERCPRLELIRADAAYQGKRLKRAAASIGCRMEISRRDKNSQGFSLEKGRWQNERFFAWLGNDRRLSKDYERNPQTSQAFIDCSMSKTLLKRLRYQG